MASIVRPITQLPFKFRCFESAVAVTFVSKSHITKKKYIYLKIQPKNEQNVNDEPPECLFQMLLVDALDKRYVITNETMSIMDLDSDPSQLVLTVKEPAQNGKYPFSLSLFHSEIILLYR